VYSYSVQILLFTYPLKRKRKTRRKTRRWWRIREARWEKGERKDGREKWDERRGGGKWKGGHAEDYKMKELHKWWILLLLTTVAFSGGAGGWDVGFNTGCWTALIQWQQTAAVVVCWVASLLVKSWCFPTSRFFDNTTRISIKSVCNRTFNNRHCLFRETVHLLVVKLEALFGCECCHTSILLTPVRSRQTLVMSLFCCCVRTKAFTKKILQMQDGPTQIRLLPFLETKHHSQVAIYLDWGFIKALLSPPWKWLDSTLM